MPIGIMKNDGANAVAEALEKGEGLDVAFAKWQEEIAQSIRADFEDMKFEADQAVLASRGVRQLTAPENVWYEGLIGALTSTAPMQAFADFIGSNVMPETIMDEIMGEIKQNHPLLSAIDFKYTGYCTKWPRSKTGVKKAVWGKITATITEEITGSVDMLTITQNKLTGYALVPLDILDMGPKWVDAYVRAILVEAIYEGLEDAIINGTGHEQPVGLIRDVHVGVSIDSSTGYPAKTAVELNSLREEDYNAVIANLANTEFGKARSFEKVYAIMNMYTKLTKWDPAIPASYVGGPRQMSFPTEVLVSNEIANNKVVIFVPGRYTFAVGGKRNGNIEFSDEFKFLEDMRAFKIIQHGDGIAEDNTAAIYCDVANMRPFVQRFIDLKNDGTRLEQYSVTISDTVYNAEINHAEKTAVINVPNGSTITGLAGTFVLSEGASAKIGGTAQVSGTTTNNWTSGTAKNFVVTAEDGVATCTYKIKIVVASA